jgi:hypothetical protein
MSKHTPGPWLIDLVNYHAGHIASVTTANGPDRFEVWSTNWPQQDQCEANAKLIAAAPELLKALIELRDEVAGSKLFERREFVQLGITVNDAIEKATR